MDYIRLCEEISAGFFDGSLQDIQSACDARAGIILTKIFPTKFKVEGFKVGDKVAFNLLASPKYIQGLTAVVTKINISRVVILMDRTAGRFQAGERITAPMSILNKV